LRILKERETLIEEKGVTLCRSCKEKEGVNSAVEGNRIASLERGMISDMGQLDWEETCANVIIKNTFRVGRCLSFLMRERGKVYHIVGEGHG